MFGVDGLPSVCFNLFVGRKGVVVLINESYHVTGIFDCTVGVYSAETSPQTNL